MTSVGSAAAPLGTDSPDGLLASGATDPGMQREVNEDRYHCNPALGLFMVIDGVGGQAAGGRAADVALDILRQRLARQTDSVADSIRNAITSANNEIYRLAATRPEWEGMACVLTLVVVRNGVLTYGHVGDSRLYKLYRDSIEKLTRDHSPVGEREDANEISERQAMHHSRRNEVYRDVGSELHDPTDRDFIDVGEAPFEPDAALLLCSDGLTDLVDSTSIARTVAQYAGAPDGVVRALIDAANAAGGKDNVTAVYVEGASFAATHYGRTPIHTKPMATAAPQRDDHASRRGGPALGRAGAIATVLLLSGLAVLGVGRAIGWWSLGDLLDLRVPAILRSADGNTTVAAGESIARALDAAASGSTIVVEPGEYREQLTLKTGVRLVSRVPREATIRLPATVPDGANVAAVVARNVSDAEFVGFKVSGDSATPLPVGIFVENSALSIVNVEITGATQTAIEFVGGGTSALMASEIRDNAGAALVIRDRDEPSISYNSFARNGTSSSWRPAVAIQTGGAPTFLRNVFVGMTTSSFAGLDGAAQAAVTRENYFVPNRPTSGR